MTTAALRFPWLTLVLALVMIAGAVAPESLQESLSLGGGAAGDIRWWQTMTCHGVHFGWGHFWRDVPALLLLSGFIEGRDRTGLSTVLGVAAVAVPLSVWWLEPGILTYRGSSGLVVAVYTWLASGLIRHRSFGWPLRLAGIAALVLLAAKIWMEMSEGRLLEAATVEVSVAWSAHLGGAMAGLVTFLIPETRLLLPRKTALQTDKGSRL